VRLESDVVFRGLADEDHRPDRSARPQVHFLRPRDLPNIDFTTNPRAEVRELQSFLNNGVDDPLVDARNNKERHLRRSGRRQGLVEFHQHGKKVLHRQSSVPPATKVSDQGATITGRTSRCRERRYSENVNVLTKNIQPA